jgi:pyrimidine-specific ribonucleoside hydrolase
LTNIATALRREPRIASRIVEISLMGGSATIGNSTPAAEFNNWFDPEAAHIVFTSGIPIKMCGLNLTHQVIAGEAEAARIRAIPTRVAQFVADLLSFYADKQRLRTGAGSGALHDPCAVACLIDSSLVEFYDMHVAVELRGQYTYGMTVCDARHLRGVAYGLPQQVLNPRGEKPNAQVGMKIDAERFFKLLSDTLAMYT